MARLTDPDPMRPLVPPAPRPSLPPAGPELQQRAWAALTLVLLGVIGLTMIGNIRRGVIVVLVVMTITAAGLWLAGTGMARARRSGVRRPRGSMVATVLGIMVLLFSAFTLIGFAMFWPQLTQYANCMSGAGTVSAQQACQTQLNNSVGTRMTLFGG